MFIKVQWSHAGAKGDPITAPIRMLNNDDLQVYMGFKHLPINWSVKQLPQEFFSFFFSIISLRASHSFVDLFSLNI